MCSSKSSEFNDRDFDFNLLTCKARLTDIGPEDASEGSTYGKNLELSDCPSTTVAAWGSIEPIVLQSLRERTGNCDVHAAEPCMKNNFESYQSARVLRGSRIKSVSWWQQRRFWKARPCL